jgi:Tfp pilus assembly protein PilX
MIRLAHTTRTQRGVAVLYVLVLIILLAIVSTTVFAAAAANLGMVRRAHADRLLLNVADAGIDKAVYEIANDPEYSGEQNTSFASARFSINIAREGETPTYRITSTAFLILGDKERSSTICAGVRMEREGDQTVGRIVQWGAE